MTSLDVAAELHQAGRFSEALRELETVKISYDSRSAGNVLKAELLQALGRHHEARALATHLLKAEHLPVAQKSSLEYVLGKAARENGDVDLAIEHLQRSVLLAKTCPRLQAAVPSTVGPDAYRERSVWTRGLQSSDR